MAFGSDGADFGEVVSEATVVLRCCADGRFGCGGGPCREQIVNDFKAIKIGVWNCCGLLLDWGL